jgi:hypothetical protein
MLLAIPPLSPGAVNNTHRPLAINLQEHHCLSPDPKLSVGCDDIGYGDDILNAWMPQGTTVHHEEVNGITRCIFTHTHDNITGGHRDI